MFFAQRGNNRIARVYGKEALDRLHSLVELHEEFIDEGNLCEYGNVVKEAEVAFSTWGMPQFSEAEIRTYMPELKAVFYAAGSVQEFARPFLHCGVKIFSAWAANAVPVAEYSAAQIILAGKGFFQGAARTKRKYEEGGSYCEAFPGNYSIRVGIIGAGMIGKKVIELLKPYHITVMVF